MNEELRQRLIAMIEEDRRVRAELEATGELFHGYAPRMAEVHGSNALELQRIIEQFGLGSLAERTEQIRKEVEGEPLPDFTKRQEEMAIWAKSVGWL